MTHFNEHTLEMEIFEKKGCKAYSVSMLNKNY